MAWQTFRVMEIVSEFKEPGDGVGQNRRKSIEHTYVTLMEICKAK